MRSLRQGLNKFDFHQDIAYCEGIPWHGVHIWKGAQQAFLAPPLRAHPIRHEKNLAMPFYIVDYVVTKSMLRSNGGAILLKDGTVVKKWSAAGLPSPEALTAMMQ